MKDQYEQYLHDAYQSDKASLDGMKKIMKIELIVPWGEVSGCKEANRKVFYEAKATYKVYFSRFSKARIKPWPAAYPIDFSFFNFLIDSDTKKMHRSAYENDKLESGSPAFYQARINDLEWILAIFNHYLDLRDKDIEEFGNDANKISDASNRNYSFDVPVPSKKKK